MKILVAGWDSGGGVEAVQTVVRRAAGRSHQVRVLGTEGLRSRFEPAGAGSRVYRYAPDNDTRQRETDLQKAIGQVLDDHRYQAAAGHMAELLAAERDDGLVVDELERTAARG